MVKASGVIIFRRENNAIKYLLLEYAAGPGIKENYWGFPKGRIEEGETESKAMRREVFEETGINDLELVPKFRETIKYFFRTEKKTVFKIVVFYLGETKTEEIKLSHEHVAYKWLDYDESLKFLHVNNHRDLLGKANERLMADEK